MKIDAPLLVALMLPAKKARLLLVSSQASPPSSQLSFQRPVANLTDSMVSWLFKTTVLPSASTSLPPQDHKYGYHQAGASPNVCPAVWQPSISCPHPARRPRFLGRFCTRRPLRT